jgi:hypothetical protein
MISLSKPWKERWKPIPKVVNGAVVVDEEGGVAEEDVVGVDVAEGVAEVVAIRNESVKTLTPRRAKELLNLPRKEAFPPWLLLLKRPEWKVTTDSSYPVPETFHSYFLVSSKQIVVDFLSVIAML